MRKEIYFLMRFAMNPLVASATDSKGSETASWSPVIDFQVKWVNKELSKQLLQSPIELEFLNWDENRQAWDVSLSFYLQKSIILANI